MPGYWSNWRPKKSQGVKDRYHMTDPSRKLRGQMAWNFSQCKSQALTVVALGWLMRRYCEPWSDSPNKKENTPGQTPFQKQATSTCVKGGLSPHRLLPVPGMSFFHCCLLAISSLFRDLNRNKREEKHHCIMTCSYNSCRKTWVNNGWNSPSLLYLLILWLKTTIGYLSHTVLKVD